MITSGRLDSRPISRIFVCHSVFFLAANGKETGERRGVASENASCGLSSGVLMQSFFRFSSSFSKKTPSHTDEFTDLTEEKRGS